MKLNPAFVLRTIHSSHLLIPVQRNGFTKNPIAINETAFFIISICSLCNNSTQLLDTTCEQFQVQKFSDNYNSIRQFISYLTENNIIQEEENK